MFLKSQVLIVPRVERDKITSIDLIQMFRK